MCEQASESAGVWIVRHIESLSLTARKQASNLTAKSLTACQRRRTVRWSLKGEIQMISSAFKCFPNAPKWFPERFSNGLIVRGSYYQAHTLSRTLSIMFTYSSILFAGFSSFLHPFFSIPFFHGENLRAKQFAWSFPDLSLADKVIKIHRIRSRNDHADRLLLASKWSERLDWETDFISAISLGFLG